MDKKSKLNLAKVSRIIKEYGLSTTEKIISFLITNENKYSFFDLSKIAENANQLRMENSAYYTDEELLEVIEKELPEFQKEDIRILEPSVGVGNFLPLLFKKYHGKKMRIDVVDLDNDSLEILKTLLSFLDLPSNIKISFFNEDFCCWSTKNRYDLAIGNPPFSKIKKDYFTNKETKYYYNLDSTNLASYFYEKCVNLSDYVCMVLPKNILNTPEFGKTRDFLRKKDIQSIIDFGENGFKGVLVETIFIKTSTMTAGNKTKVYSLTKDLELVQKRDYITDPKLPYWVIFRNEFFDDFSSKLEFDVFTCFRDRQLTSKNTSFSKGEIRVLKSRNISDDGQSIIDLPGYDEYISKAEAESKAVYSYLNMENVYLTPNMTYKVRVMKKPNGYLVNGSVAILLPKRRINLNKEDLIFFSSDEYRNFMQIARNYQTRTLNIDSTSVYFFGIRRK